jgi:hypothetical protein
MSGQWVDYTQAKDFGGIGSALFAYIDCLNAALNAPENARFDLMKSTEWPGVSSPPLPDCKQCGGLGMTSLGRVSIGKNMEKPDEVVGEFTEFVVCDCMLRK